MGNAKLPPGFDAATIHASIAERRGYFDQIAAQRAELIQEHEGEWVIAYKGEFRFGVELDDVIREGRLAGWPLGIVAIEQLHRERPAVLLRHA